IYYEEHNNNQQHICQPIDKVNWHLCQAKDKNQCRSTSAVSNSSSKWRDNNTGYGKCNVGKSNYCDRCSQVIMQPERRECNIETDEQEIAKCQNVGAREANLKERS